MKKILIGTILIASVITNVICISTLRTFEEQNIYQNEDEVYIDFMEDDLEDEGIEILESI